MTLPDESSRRITEETGSQRLIGYTLEVGHADGGARCRLIADERHVNRQNTLHGGIATLLLDNACAVSASLTVDDTGRQPFTTLSLNVNFLAAGHMGGVTAIGRVTGGGRKIIFASAELVHDDGTLIATASGVFKRAPVPPAGSGEGGAAGA